MPHIDWSLDAGASWLLGYIFLVVLAIIVTEYLWGNNK